MTAQNNNLDGLVMWDLFNESIICFFSDKKYSVGEVACLNFASEDRFYQITSIGDNSSTIKPYFVREI